MAERTRRDQLNEMRREFGPRTPAQGRKLAEMLRVAAMIGAFADLRHGTGQGQRARGDAGGEEGAMSLAEESPTLSAIIDREIKILRDAERAAEIRDAVRAERIACARVACHELGGLQ